jgi:hypothetical protein
MAGCAAREAAPKPGAAPARTAPATGSDRDTAADALTSELSTLAVYRALARRHVAAQLQIEPLIAVQRRHVDALVDALDLDEPPTTPTVNLVATPVDVAIADAARDAARGRLAECRRVESGSLASMLASMAAAHQVVASLWAPE